MGSAVTSGRRADDADRDHLRVLWAHEDEEQLALLVPTVALLGHEVVAGVIEVALVAEVAARERPDVALVSVGQSTEHALDMIGRIVHEAICPVIALIPARDPDFVTEASKRGVFAVVTDPEEWQGALDVVLCRFAEQRELQAAFGRRTTIEHANGILMARHSLSGDAAFAMLRDHARRGNRKVTEVAAAIVEVHVLLPERAPSN